MEKQVYDDFSLSERKNFWKYQNNIMSSKLGKELYAIANLFEECFTELVPTIEDGDTRKQILEERIIFLLELLKDRSEELCCINEQLSSS